jgi:transposase-like protein
MKRASFFRLTEEYASEDDAIRYFEDRRWPGGDVHCPKCGSRDVRRGNQAKRRRQLWYCHACEHMFSVTSGTVMEFTKLPLRKWLLAFHLMGASKKGISALQLSRMLGVQYNTAWHLSHRIRKTMGFEQEEKFTGIVETDEMYSGGRRRGHGRGYRGNKVAVQTIVKRNSEEEHDGQAHTIALNNGEKVDGRAVGAKLRTFTDPEKTVLMTDDSNIYNRVGQSFLDHRSVNHSKEEYARVDPDGVLVSTNSAEGLFANLQRQISGTHHHTSKKHLPKYLEEFDYKYNTREETDTERTEGAIANMYGKALRLYKPVSGHGESLFDRKKNPDPEAPEAAPATPATPDAAEVATEAAGVPNESAGERRR